MLKIKDFSIGVLMIVLGIVLIASGFFMLLSGVMS